MSAAQGVTSGANVSLYAATQAARARGAVADNASSVNAQFVVVPVDAHWSNGDVVLSRGHDVQYLAVAA